MTRRTDPMRILPAAAALVFWQWQRTHGRRTWPWLLTAAAAYEEIGLDGEVYHVEADLVVHGAGRVPATDHLDLAAASIETEHGAVKVTPWMQSST